MSLPPFDPTQFNYNKKLNMESLSVFYEESILEIDKYVSNSLSFNLNGSIQKIILSVEEHYF